MSDREEVNRRRLVARCQNYDTTAQLPSAAALALELNAVWASRLVDFFALLDTDKDWKATRITPGLDLQAAVVTLTVAVAGFFDKGIKG